MKRSEMVKALMEKFNHVFIGVHAETIIDFLESKGMLPPAYETYVKVNENLILSKAYRKINVNKWEPEQARDTR